MSNKRDIQWELMFQQLVETWKDALSTGQSTKPLRPLVQCLPADFQEEFPKRLILLQLLRQILPSQTNSEEPLQKLGRFELVQEIGRGGFGIVYRAQDEQLGRSVAVKKLHIEGDIDTDSQTRFIREARAMAKLHHPGIVEVHEVAESAPYFLVSEYYEKGSLADWLRERDGPVPPRQAAWLMAQVADALQHAHQNGLIHRDLKPSNILLASVENGKDKGPGGLDVRPLLNDFGSVKVFTKTDAEISDNLTGSIPIGTPSYMSPEQLRPDAQELEPTSDVFSFGIVLYQLLTGFQPFKGSSLLETFTLIHEKEPDPPRHHFSTIPRDLETICLKCLQKQPIQRYTSAEDLAADLRRFLSGEQIMARPTGLLEKSWRCCCKHPTITTLLFALLLTVICGVSGILFNWQAAHDNYITARFQKSAAQKAAQKAEKNALKEKKARREAEKLLTELQLLIQDIIEINPGDYSRPVNREQFGLVLTKLDLRCKSLLKDRRDHISLLRTLAQTHLAWGIMDQDMSEYENAEEHFLYACQILKEALQHRSNNKQLQYDLVKVLERLGSVHVVKRDHGKSLNCFEESYSLSKRFATVSPIPKHHRTLATSGFHLADRLLLFQRYQRAANILSTSRKHLRDIPPRQKVETDQYLLAQIHYQTGKLWEKRGKLDLAENAWQKTFETVDTIRSQYYLDRMYLDLLGPISLKMQKNHSSNSHYGKCIAYFESMYARTIPSLKSDPTNIHLHRISLKIITRLNDLYNVANAGEDRIKFADLYSLTHLRTLQQLRNSPRAEVASLDLLTSASVIYLFGFQDKVAANKLAEQALEIINPVLSKVDKDVTRKQMSIIRYSPVVSRLLRQTDNTALALQLANSSLGFYQKCYLDNPYDQDTIFNIFETWEQLGKCYVKLDDPDQASDSWENGINFLNKAMKKSPSASSLKIRLGDRYIRLARHYLELGQTANAEKSLREYVAMWPDNVNKLTEAENVYRILADQITARDNVPSESKRLVLQHIDNLRNQITKLNASNSN